MPEFRALLATEDSGAITVRILTLSRQSLPPGQVLVRVTHSSLNYKDGAAVSGRPGFFRKLPMVPGIDFAGAVEESDVPEFKLGDNVVLTGAGAGETRWGGYAQYARWDAEHLVKLPNGFTAQQAMAIGTAGFTAMQCVMALERSGLQPGGREVLVTGAGGGVGSIAVAILSTLGYRVAASTGRPELAPYLRSLGAHQIVDRAALNAPPAKPLAKEQWDGAIDSVGGATLAGLLPAMAERSAVAMCGLAGGAAFTSTVLPMILRGVSLLGVNSVNVTPVERREVWDRLVTDLPLALLDNITHVEPLERIFDLSRQILDGQIRGRVVIDVNA